MRNRVVALSLLAVALVAPLSACGNQAGGKSNPDSQVSQPPLPGTTGDARPQGGSASPSPSPSVTGPTPGT
jgi:hypothetical protein